MLRCIKSTKNKNCSKHELTKKTDTTHSNEKTVCRFMDEHANTRLANHLLSRPRSCPNTYAVATSVTTVTTLKFNESFSYCDGARSQPERFFRACNTNTYEARVNDERLTVSPMTRAHHSLARTTAGAEGGEDSERTNGRPYLLDDHFDVLLVRRVVRPSFPHVLRCTRTHTHARKHGASIQ